MYLAVPYVVLRLLWKSFSNPAYRQRLPERFGYIAIKDSPQPILWIHAVSVGEVHATRPLIDKILGTYPAYQIVISTMTPTGAETVQRLYGKTARHVYVPYDLPDAVVRFVSRLQPALLIVMETEIWPNLFHVCHSNNVPVIMVNGRLSEKSYSAYKRIRHLMSETLANITKLITQTREDAERFTRLGMDPLKTEASGSLKFDIELSVNVNNVDEHFSIENTSERQIWIAASTHAGEEEIILAVQQQLQQHYPECLLIIAPRHPDRAALIAELGKRSGFNTVLRSQVTEINRNINVFVVDTMGELPGFYALSGIAFVGGSLVPVGGHNMLEPASLGVPVIMGPHVHNFTEIAAQLIEAGAAWRVQNQEQLQDIIFVLFRDSAKKAIAGNRARDLILRNRGTSDRVLQMLAPLLSRHATSAHDVI